MNTLQMIGVSLLFWLAISIGFCMGFYFGRTREKRASLQREIDMRPDCVHLHSSAVDKSVDKLLITGGRKKRP